MALMYTGRMELAEQDGESVQALRELGDMRAHTEALKARVQLLDPPDRVLMELVPTGMRSIRQVARMLDANPGTLSRRMRTVWRRINHPLVNHLMGRQCVLSAEYRQLGIERYMLGMSAQVIAERHRMKASDVRRILEYLRGYARGLGIGV